MHAHSTVHTALHQKVKTCATSLNDDKFPHPVIFGVFGGQFCDMSMQKIDHFDFAGIVSLPGWYLNSFESQHTTQHNTQQST